MKSSGTSMPRTSAPRVSVPVPLPADAIMSGKDGWHQPEQQQAGGGPQGPPGPHPSAQQPQHRSLPPYHSYSLPALSGASSHAPLPGGPPGNNSAPSAPQQQQQAPPPQQQQQQGPPPPHGIQASSPAQALPGIQASPINSQGPQMQSAPSAQGPVPQQQQQQGPGGPNPHPLSGIGAQQVQSQQPGPPQHQMAMVPGMNQGQGQVQQQASNQMPPSAGVPGNGPGGPILNFKTNLTTFAQKDALSYLDQVKFQFQDQPDVYNKFLDIMKDFKSQTIDTPGVINRVSSLFSGHPSLIQGFNTFLPPGYRIECSQDPRDTKITVTTPSGVHHASSGGDVSIGTGSGLQINSSSLNGVVSNGNGQPPHSRFYEQQGSRWGSVDGMYGPYGPGGGPPGPGGPGPQQQQQSQQPEPMSAHQMHQQQLAAHQAQAQAQQQAAQQAQQQAQQQQQQAQQQQAQHQASVQQGVNQLQSAAAHTNGTMKGPGGMGVGGPGTPTGVGESKTGKGPVEFNHAISYVNKIKNRFAQQPDIYKNFLEILQTYQRENKPIQDVYSQVTQLFHSAPDLLEDFKQFLPESAAQARAAAAAKAAAADEAAANADAGIGPATSVPGPGGVGARLPPVGNFAPPPSVGKENKKKRGPGGSIIPQEPKVEVLQNSSIAAPIARGPNKHQKPTIAEQLVAVSPTLTPFQPEPLGPHPQPVASTEELAFFDRVKKFIGNKQTYNEFLKLLNLFSQDLIGKDMLVDKVANFIGGNRELMDWFKRFVGWEGRDEVVDNVPRQLNRVRLSVCRGLGPSYRLLPKLEAQKPCSGRDEMCWEVLNDQWASHPTWASEDSGFVAHKKNQYEDILHRIEEERHDYDFNIEANLRTIQLLEPIAQRIAGMTPEEKANFQLSPGLGGQSKTIYQRIIKKVYDKEKGLEVIEMLHKNPVMTVPIVLKRLKQKDEEWKAAQREWQKVWRDQTARVFWKSLDHQGITIKANDKKLFGIKSLVNEIQAKHREQVNKRLSPTTPSPEYQFQYSFADFGIILDASRLLAVSLEHNSIFNANDREKIDGFIKSFIPLFFGMNSRDVEDTVNAIIRKSPDDDVDEGHSPAAGDSSSRSRRGGRHDHDLLRDVLKRGKNGKSRKDKEGSITSRGSKESTPEVVHDEDIHMTMDSSVDGRPSREDGTWISRPIKHLADRKPGTPTSQADEPVMPVKRTVYTLYCNTTIYGFFRTFQILCGRLADIKSCEAAIRKDVDIRKQYKVANELNIASSKIEDLFTDTGPNANFYSQVLDMCEKFIEGDIDSNSFEESLRSVYIQKGWQLYTIDKLLVAVLKFIQAIVPNDTKEKNPEKEKNADIVLRFQRDRERREFTKERGEYQELIAYRRNVEAMLGPEDNVYRIDWHEDTKQATIRFVPRDEVTVNNDLDKDERWNYYIQTYMMSSPTEGIPLERCRKVFLRRNLPDEDDMSEAGSPRDPSSSSDGACFEERMTVRICVNTYRLFFKEGAEDFIVQTRKFRTGRGSERLGRVKEARKRRWHEEVLGKSPWMEGLSEAEKRKKCREWETFVAGDNDVEMGEV
ncbi:Transcriptional regulatory protein sin3 [Rhizina undulata]